MSFVSNTQLKRFAGDINTAIENGTIKAGLAKNLTPYSGEMNIFQDVAFNLQGTATANGEGRIDTDTYCLLKEKRGNTVTVNQLVQNPNFVNTNNWSASNGVLTVANNIGTFTGNSEATNKNYAATGVVANKPVGHKYLGFFEYISNHNFNTQMASTGFAVPAANSFTSKAFIQEKASAEYGSWYFYNYNGVTDWVLQLKNVFAIDLTLWFGSNDKIPTHLLNHPEDFFRYYQGDLSYNVGTLTDCNGRYLKTTGRNVCDEVFEGGLISGGSDSPNTEGFRTKNYQRVVPNTPYHLHSGIEISGYYVHEYDSNKNYLKSTSIYENNQVITLSPNTIFVRLSFWKSNSGWGSNVPAKDVAQIVLSLYCEGESGYDQYYPYEELANIDTGNEPLLAFDWKEPNGTIHRDTLPRIDMGTLTWTKVTTGTSENPVIVFNGSVPNGAICDDNPSSIICAKYAATKSVNIYTGSVKNAISMFTSSGNKLLWVQDANYSSGTAEAFATAMSGVYLETKADDAHKTTEQGTPFKEGIGINDFGTMEFVSTNGIPQGNKILYSPDYKASLDTLCKYLDGNMSNITKLEGVGESLSDSDPKTVKEILNEIRALHAIEQENAGGALRHMLVDRVTAGGGTLDFANTTWLNLGNLNWNRQSSSDVNFFIATVSDKAIDNANMICPIYKTVAVAGHSAMNNLEIGIKKNVTSNQVAVRDDSYTNATAFKNAMKGILLAYEKAST